MTTHQPIPLDDMITLSDIVTQYELVGRPMQQQQMVYDCPACAECNTQREFYKHLREIKSKPFAEKVDITFQANGIIWGALTIVIIILVVGAIFRKEVFDFVIQRWFPSKIKRRRKT